MGKTSSKSSKTLKIKGFGPKEIKEAEKLWKLAWRGVRGFLEVRILSKRDSEKTYITSLYFKTTERFSNILKVLADLGYLYNYDCYFLPTPVKNKKNGASGEEDTVGGSKLVILDADIYSGKKEQKEFIKKLKEFVEPTAIIKSGGGLQVWFVLSSPVSLSEAKQLMRAMARKLGISEHENASPVVLRRLPCSFNFKYSPKRPVKILEFSGDEIHPELLRQKLKEFLEEKQKKQAEPSVEVLPSPQRLSIDRIVENLRKFFEKYRQIWMPSVQVRHWYYKVIVRHLLDLGYTDSEIQKAVKKIYETIEVPFGSPWKLEERLKYLSSEKSRLKRGKERNRGAFSDGLLYNLLTRRFGFSKHQALRALAEFNRCFGKEKKGFTGLDFSRFDSLTRFKIERIRLLFQKWLKRFKEKEQKEPTSQETYFKLADLLAGEFLFIFTRSGDLWRYDFESGIWKNDGELFLKQVLEFVAPLSKNGKQEVIEHIKARFYRERFPEPPKLLIPLRGGCLNLETWEFEPHSPDNYITYFFPHSYNPNPEPAPVVESFLRSIIPPEQLPLLQEIAGWLLYPEYRPHKIVFLLGSGSNGKSTFINFLRFVLGPENCSSVSLHDLSTNRFALSLLFNKLANFYPDISAREIKSCSNIKALTGEDVITADRKFLPPIQFRNRAKLVFACNKLPKIRDSSYAFWRRLVLLHFPYTFTGKRRDPHLLDKLCTEENAQWFIGWALQGLKRLLENGEFSIQLDPEELHELYTIWSNSVAYFLKECCELKEGAQISKNELYHAYRLFCSAKGIGPVSSKAFSVRLKELVKVGEKRTSKERFWVGIRLKEDFYEQINAGGEEQKEKQIMEPGKEEAEPAKEEKTAPEKPAQKEEAPQPLSPPPSEVVKFRVLKPVKFSFVIEGKRYGPFEEGQVVKVPPGHLKQFLSVVGYLVEEVVENAGDKDQAS